MIMSVPWNRKVRVGLGSNYKYDDADENDSYSSELLRTMEEDSYNVSEKIQPFST